MSNIIQNRSMGPSSLVLWKLVSMLKISFPKVLLCSFHQCEKFQNMGVMHSVFFFFLHVPHQIPVHLFGVLFAHISDHDPLQAKQGLLGFLLLPSVLGIS